VATPAARGRCRNSGRGAILGAHQLFLAYSAWNTDIADTISSQSDWKAKQKRAEKKAKTTTQPPMSEGDMVIRFRARNGRAAREARETAMAK
jgi:hypothetical protein